MGGFGNIARTIGGVGNDVSTARFNLDDLRRQQVAQQIDLQMKRLQLQQLQQKLGQPAPQPQLLQQIAAAEHILGRPLTDSEKQIFLGLAPTPKAPVPTPEPKTLLELFQQDPERARSFLQMQESVKPTKSEETNTPFAVWRTQNPNAPISDWFKLQEKYKKTGAANVGSSPMDSSIQAAANGQINPPNPATKLGSAWWARAAELGLDSQIRTRSFAGSKTTSVDAAQKAYNAELDKYNKWSTDHYLVRHAMANPYAESLAQKKGALDQAKADNDVPEDVDPNDFLRAK